MVSIDSRLGAVESQMSSFKEILERIEKMHRSDHDTVLRLEGKVDSLDEKVDEIRSNHREDRTKSTGRFWQGFFIVLAATVGATFHWISTKLKGE